MSDRGGLWRFSSNGLAHISQATFVRTIEHHVALPSTNDRAVELSQDSGVEVPALILTDLQTSGRGRGENSWWAAPGALTFSLVLDRPDHAVWQRVSLTAGLAVCDTLRQLCPTLEIGLKWPNDIFVQAKKISGVLIEAPPQRLGRYVIGIGVNVNNSLTQAAAGLSSKAVSLADVAGCSFDLTRVLTMILEQLHGDLEQLGREDERLIQRWRSFCVLTGSRVRVEAGSQVTSGICRGIAPDGTLLVQTKHGIQRCLTGTVSAID